MIENYEKLEDIGKGKYISKKHRKVANLSISTLFCAIFHFFWLIQIWGVGSFGRVSKVRRVSDGRILVWKELDYGKMNDKEKQQIVAEVNILRDLQHPNIVRYYDRCVDKRNLKLYIVMEYCEKGDL